MAGGISTVPAVLVGGITTIAINTSWMRLFQGISRIDRLDQIDTDEIKG